MLHNFEFDTNAQVAIDLRDDPGIYILDRVQEIHGTRYARIIHETAELAVIGDDTLETKYKRLAFAAGATVVLEAFDYSGLPKPKIDYTKHVFLCSGLPAELKKQDADTIREQIEFSSLIGHASHQELQQITDVISRYYVEITQDPAMQLPVSLGVGRMAFVLDKCFGALRTLDPQFDIVQTLEETDWSNIEPEDIIEEKE
jgi:hypothetical protein